MSRMNDLALVVLVACGAMTLWLESLLKDAIGPSMRALTQMPPGILATFSWRQDVALSATLVSLFGTMTVTTILSLLGTAAGVELTKRLR